MPTDTEPQMCEAWLRTAEKCSEDFNDGSDFFSLCKKLGIDFFRDEKVCFPERLVVLIKVDKEQLSKLLIYCDQIAEFRRVRETAKFWVEQLNKDQSGWVRDLKERLSVDDKSNIFVCILDTGINNGHELIAPILSDDDCHSVKDWEADDKEGHGTLMSGLVIYGDLQKALESQSNVAICHKVESVKLIPASGEIHPKNLYGHITKQAVSRVEIENSQRKRILCMAITSIGSREGRPSSWSGALDQITSGAEAAADKRRLFILSIGNVRGDEWKNYPSSNYLNSVHDPAQSWNALAVGAYTDKDMIAAPDLSGYTTVAKKGALSPFSTTSLTWEGKWPIKPDIVLEGGNVAIDKTDFVTSLEDLSLLSLSHKPQERQFEIINATSAATAQASWIASQIQVKYPEIWPETIRALMVHSAKWNGAMKEQVWDDQRSDKDNYKNILRVFGYGIPDLDNALSSYANSLTLVSEQELQPFVKDQGKAVSTKDMHFYEMPWPSEILRDLPGGAKVRFRFTLSYFIEPGPGEIGWKDKYRYPSHGLRFAICGPQENQDEFIKRINKAAREGEGGDQSTSNNPHWLLGPQGRNLGSIHSDMFESDGASIAARNLMAVYPTTGWWKERDNLQKYNKRARYVLIVSLSTPEENIDIYTPVTTKISTPIPAEIIN